jgi:hypothetical protein
MSPFQETIMRSIQAGEVDGELQIMSKEGEIIESQHFPYGGKVQMETKETENGKMIKVQVQSQEKIGKILMLRIQGELLDDVEAGSVRVYFDSEKAVRSGDVNQVLEGNTSNCKYYLEKDGDGCYQAMVYVPGFSVHELEFSAEDEQEDSPMLSLGTAMLIFGLIVVALGILTYKRKRSD